MSTAYFTDPRLARHTLRHHPENAGRLAVIQRCMKEQHLLERMQLLEAESLADEDILAVHTSEYLALLQHTTQRPSGVMFGFDTYVLPESYEVACLAAGGTKAAVLAVMSGAASNALVVVRPPGHHATASAGMGFCLLNNAAIAVRHAQRSGAVERVMIVDYDVHHGNGTQDIFYRDSSVLYVSLHQSPLYPGSGRMSDIGEGDGLGFTANIPLPPGTGDKGYAQVTEAILWPLARRFAPGLLVISVGFDAHWADPLSNMQVSLAGYDHVARGLITMADTLCAGKAVFVLEGGYDPAALSNGCANIAHALLGNDQRLDPLGLAEGDEPSNEDLIDRIRQLHKLA